MDLWTSMLKRFDEWTPPLRPSPEDVEMYRNQIQPQMKTLLLGVTPELLPLASLAIDHNPQLVDMQKSHAILGDWKNLPFDPEFDAVIGDGCLNVFQGKPEVLFQQANKVLKKGGKLILRLFISPEKKESLDAVFAAKKKMSFHAFKWRVAQAVADPYIAVKDLYRIIQPIWDHSTLNIYRSSDLIYYFPKLTDLPKWDVIQFASSYELAERCPVVTWLSK
jgi:SAM-dependent methyltransferase